MQFVIKRDVLLRSLTLVQGIIEKKNTLPILSNVLIEAKNGKLAIIATDLDLVFYDEII
jgi:DNA polymerase-3 subunit beta